MEETFKLILAKFVKGWVKFVKSLVFDFVWQFLLLLWNIVQYLWNKYKGLCRSYPLAVNGVQLGLFVATLVIMMAYKDHKIHGLTDQMGKQLYESEQISDSIGLIEHAKGYQAGVRDSERIAAEKRKLE